MITKRIVIVLCSNQTPVAYIKLSGLSFNIRQDKIASPEELVSLAKRSNIIKKLNKLNQAYKLKTLYIGKKRNDDRYFPFLYGQQTKCKKISIVCVILTLVRSDSIESLSQNVNTSLLLFLKVCFPSKLCFVLEPNP